MIFLIARDYVFIIACAYCFLTVTRKVPLTKTQGVKLYFLYNKLQHLRFRELMEDTGLNQIVNDFLQIKLHFKCNFELEASSKYLGTVICNLWYFPAFREWVIKMQNLLFLSFFFIYLNTTVCSSYSWRFCVFIIVSFLFSPIIRVC
jgi:hypothetical protein